MSLKSMLAFIAKYLLGIAHLGNYIFVYLCFSSLSHYSNAVPGDKRASRSRCSQFHQPTCCSEAGNMSNQDANAVAESKSRSQKIQIPDIQIQKYKNIKSDS